MQTFGVRVTTPLQELEVVALDRRRVPDLANRTCMVGGLKPTAVPSSLRKADGELAVAHLDAVEFFQEIDVEIGAAELAVGDPLQPDLFLPPHHLRMHSSSTARSAAASISLAKNFCRASRKAAGRRKLPT